MNRRISRARKQIALDYIEQQYRNHTHLEDSRVVYLDRGYDSDLADLFDTIEALMQEPTLRARTNREIREALRRIANSAIENDLC